MQFDFNLVKHLVGLVLLARTLSLLHVNIIINFNPYGRKLTAVWRHFITCIKTILHSIAHVMFQSALVSTITYKYIASMAGTIQLITSIFTVPSEITTLTYGNTITIGAGKLVVMTDN